MSQRLIPMRKDGDVMENFVNKLSEQNKTKCVAKEKQETGKR